MKSFLFALCAMLLLSVQTSDVVAGGVQEIRDKADTYYQQQNFKKAYKEYFKLAKIGDHYSQERVSGMYARGEGKSVDLNEAYAWAALAAEGGKDQLVLNSVKLLEQAENKTKAQNKAEKLKKKYGKEALARKVAAIAKREAKISASPCVGSRFNCN